MRRGRPDTVRGGPSTGTAPSTGAPAFTDGLGVTAGLGTVAMVVCGVLDLILLRGSDRPGEDEAESDDGAGADPEPSDEFSAPTGSVRVRNDDTEPTGRLP